MKVIFKTLQKLGNRSYNKGENVVPDELAHNRAFQELVKTGAAQILPRDQVAQKTQSARDAKAFQKAQAARIAHKALPSAQTASGASHSLPSAVGAAQPLPTPAKPIQAGVAAQASAPATPVTARDKE